MKVGEKVHYIPFDGCPESLYENGIIKSFAPNGNPFVVYNCNGEWHRIKDYTAANTPPDNLKPGWNPNARNFNQQK